MVDHSSPRLKAFASGSWDARVRLVVWLVKDHVPKVPFVHKLTAFWAQKEVLLFVGTELLVFVHCH
jgi:hypothetical protein